MPRISVLMAVHNGEPYLHQAIQSILGQTYCDFEFFIIDDASTDNTRDILVRYSDSDPRIKLVFNSVNLGLAGSLNRGLDLIDAEFVVRMDSDDISVPRRLEWQIDYMEAHEQVGIAGMWAKVFGIPERKGLIRYPTGSPHIKAFLLFANPMSHPTVMMRLQWLNKFSLRYDPVFSRSEDYDFWIRASSHFPLENMNKVGLYWRMHPDNATVSHRQTMRNQAYQLLTRQLMGIGLTPKSDELDLHYRVSAGERLLNCEELKHAEDWLYRIMDAAVKSRKYEKNGIDEAIGRIWFRLCANSTPATPWIIQQYNRSELRRGYSPAFPQWTVFFASTLWHHVVRKTFVHS